MRAIWRSILGDPDNRSPREVDRDVDDELAFHLDQIERELRDNGTPPAQVRTDALARFGDPDHYRKACRRIALQERIMLQRVNLALLLIVALALGLTAWQSLASQRRTADAVDRLAARIETMASTPAAPPVNATAATDRAGPTAPAASPATLIISGAVTRPGVYTLPPEGFTLRRLIAAAGPAEGTLDATIERFNPQGPGPLLRVTAEQLAAGEDRPVLGGDLITLVNRDNPKAGAGPGTVTVNVYTNPPRDATIPIPPDGKLTVLRAINLATPALSADWNIEVHRLNADDRREQVFGATIGRLQQERPLDMTLRPDDRVVVMQRSTLTIAGDAVGPDSNWLWAQTPALQGLRPTLGQVLASASAVPSQIKNVVIQRWDGSTRRSIELAGNDLQTGIHQLMNHGDLVTIASNDPAAVASNRQRDARKEAPPRPVEIFKTNPAAPFPPQGPAPVLIRWPIAPVTLGEALQLAGGVPGTFKTIAWRFNEPRGWPARDPEAYELIDATALQPDSPVLRTLLDRPIEIRLLTESTDAVRKNGQQLGLWPIKDAPPATNP